MNTKEDYKIRQIIPRWYPFEFAFLMEEIQSNKEPIVSICDHVSYRQKEQDWLFHKRLPWALDFVGTALISNDFPNAAAVDASRFILSNSKKISGLAKCVAEKFLQSPESPPDFNLSIHSDEIYSIISLIKKYVREYGYNAIAWTDLAFYYAVLCQNEKANLCISVALNLAPENRFILRSAARFYTHTKNPEKALFFLRKAELAKHDPWLLASEISISEAFNLRTRNVKIAKDLLAASDKSPKDLAELYGTIGTLEITHSGNKKGKKLFKHAMIAPNENTLAQAEWVSQNMGLNIKRPHNVTAAFEANSRSLFYDQNYTGALAAALNWIRFQPFCAHPVVQATYIAATCLSDFQEAIRIVEKENRCQLDNNFPIKNNYIYALASSDRIKEADRHLATINVEALKEREQGVYQATKGLIEFRKGNIEEGRLLYKNAIERFRKLKDEKSLVLAMFHLVKEEQKAGYGVKEMTDTVIRSVKRLGLRELLQDSNNDTSKKVGM